MAAARAAAHLRVRTNRLRRDGNQCHLADSGQRPDAIKTERFGMTGGDATYLPEGDAIAGDPFAVFGRERTVVVGRQRTCGTASESAVALLANHR